MSTVYHGHETDLTAFRPVLRARRLAVSSGHYLGSMAGMRMLALGGNAIDAGVAAVFAQVVLEFGAAGFGGECPILIYSARDRKVVAINGNMRAPAAATIEAYRARGVDLIPGDGFLAAGVCATPAALITALERYGTLSLAQVLQPAIELAYDGFPMYEAMLERIKMKEKRFREEWPTSAAVLLPGGRLPVVGEVWKNPDLARTYEKLVEAEQGARSRGRSAARQAAHDRFYKGDIAEAIVAFQRDTTTRHAGGAVSSGLLTLEDFATYTARVEEPVATTYRGITVHKCGPWTQGPVLLQALNLLEGFDLAGMGAGSADHVHVVTECLKLALADRDTYYTDPDFVHVPMQGLLSKAYAAGRRKLVDMRRASLQWQPGDPYPYEPGGGRAPEAVIASRPWQGGTTGTRAGDAAGNLFSATPSGGWFRDSPIVPGLGFCLGTRMQMFWLDPHHPAGLQPLKQPRTTLTPSLATKNGAPWLAFGTPGGDMQDQHALQYFLNVVDFGMDIQDAADFTAFHTDHHPNSFYPRAMKPGHLAVETTLPEAVREELAARGHNLEVVRGWTEGQMTAVAVYPERDTIEAAATSRRQKCYAIGW